MHRYEFSAPGYYRITLQGKLHPNWSERLGGMRVVAPVPEADREVTVLQGCVRDQAELSGILNSLYELHLPLLKVEYLGEDDTTSRDVTG